MHDVRVIDEEDQFGVYLAGTSLHKKHLLGQNSPEEQWLSKLSKFETFGQSLDPKKPMTEVVFSREPTKPALVLVCQIKDLKSCL